MPVTLELVAPQAGLKITDMIVHAGAIYGVALGGKLYTWDGAAWGVIVNTSVSGPTVFFRIISAGGSLYIFSGEQFTVGAGPVWVWDGGTGFTSLNIAGTYGAGSATFLVCGISHDNKLTFNINPSNTHRQIVQWTGSAWEDLGPDGWAHWEQVAKAAREAIF